VISSVEPVVNGKKVVEYGNVFGIDRFGITKDDVYMGSANRYIVSFKGTDSGVSFRDYTYSSSDINYVMTMIKNGNTKEAYNQKYYVRAYALLEDGTYAYSDVAEFTIFNVVDHLYKNNMMGNEAAHNYLYNNILKVADENYTAALYK
jgi:hypothetical protein